MQSELSHLQNESMKLPNFLYSKNILYYYIIRMSEKNAYRLLNPYIEGTIDTVVRAKNSFNAGKKLYNNISTYFTNHLDDFYMTVQNMETKDLTHFKINEKRSDNGTVDFNLVKLDEKFNPDLEKKLINNVDKLTQQSGGKHKHRHHDDDDDDDDSDSTTDEDYFYKVPVLPISRYTYFYLPYYKLNFVGINQIDRARFFMPMFSLPVNPTLEVRMDLYNLF